jgi:cyclase
MILDEVSKTCFMPLTWGGGIRTLDDIRTRISRGADKITLNTAAFQTPDLITQASKVFGSQAVVVSIDVLRHDDGRLEVFVDGGKQATGLDPADWAKQVEALGAGEILVNSIDRDGTGAGYDIDLIKNVAAATTLPVIALGGVGRYEHYADGIKAGASAVAAANIWHFKELSDRGGKRALAKAGISIRL